MKTAKIKQIKRGLVPKLRFPEFSEGWKVNSFIEVLEIIDGDRGLQYPKAEDFAPIGYCLFLNAKNVTKDGFKFDSTQFISRGKDEILRKGKLKRADIILTTRGSVGQFAYFSKDVPYDNIRINSGMVILRVKTKTINSDYLYTFSKSDFLTTNIKNNTSGNAQQQLTVAGIKNFKLYFPSLEEQQKIADCLSAIDELILAQSRKVDALKKYKKGLMQQLFPSEGETMPRLRFPEFSDDGEWEEKELGSLCDVRDGTHDSPQFYNTGKPLITSKNLLSNGLLDLKNVSFISEEDYEKINKRSKVDIGDIIFGMIGTIGNPVLVKNHGFAIKNVALIKQKTDLLNIYLLHFLNSQYIAARFKTLHTGNTQKFIALGQIRNLSFPLPKISEQQKIADCLSSIDDLIVAQGQKVDALKKHKKGLMQQLFPSNQEKIINHK